MKRGEHHGLPYAEQRRHGVLSPGADCPVCTVAYRINDQDVMYKHGARGGPCKGSHEPPGQKAA